VTIAEVIKAIISITSPNAFNPNGGNGGEQQGPPAQDQANHGVQTNASPNKPSSSDIGGPQNDIGGPQNSSEAGAEPPTTGGQRDNRLIRDLVMAHHISMLVEPMRHGLSTGGPSDPQTDDAQSDLIEVDLSSASQDPQGDIPASNLPVPKEQVESRYSFDPYQVEQRPSTASVSSSFCQSITILIELIRKNNSDYSEPYLFHSIRNRLMGMQQRKVESRFQSRETSEVTDSQKSSLEEVAQDRQDMEDTMAEMSEKLGIVHLGSLLSQISDRIGDLQEVILRPPHIVSRVSIRME
jgi:hypothetical protein